MLLAIGSHATQRCFDRGKRIAETERDDKSAIDGSNSNVKSFLEAFMNLQASDSKSISCYEEGAKSSK